MKLLTDLDPRLERLLREGPSATPFVTLPGATFAFGSDGRPDELPVHKVTVGPFAVALTPVTNAEYAVYLEASKHEPPRFWEDGRFNAPRQPVVGISWFEAVAYCEWLTELLGRRCRLPSEPEREYAARGGAALEVRYPWGDEVLSDGPFTFGAAGMDRPLPVGTTPPNGFGLFHMGENVHEWCIEWYDSRGYVETYAPDAEAPEGTRRASRGGSWRHRVKVSRIAARSSLAPERQYNDYGFRVYADAV